MVVCQQPRKLCGSQESHVAPKCVIFTANTNSPFSTPCISITTGLISIKFTYLCPPYTRPYIPNLKEIDSVVYKICIHENCPIFFTFFYSSSSSHRFTKVTLSQPKTLFLWIVLGNIPVISLHRGIEFIPVTLLRIPLYRVCINYIFLWLRGVQKVINRVANTQFACMVKVDMHL